MFYLIWIIGIALMIMLTAMLVIKMDNAGKFDS